MSEQYEVLSPWAERNPVPLTGINSRVADLNQAPLGFIQNGKKAAVPILNAVAKQLQARYPEIQSRGIYQTASINGKPVDLKEWLKGVDAVILAVGD